jgi:MFS family permease
MLARATGMLLLWLHPSFLMLGLSLVLTAASFSLVEVSMQTFVSAIGDEDQVGRNLGWFTFVMSLGMVLGPYLGGVVADSYGYGTAFLGAGITAGITIPVLLFLREQRSQSELAAEQTSWLNAIKRLAANRGLLTGVLVVTFLYFNLGAWRIYLPAYLRTLNFSPGHIGQVVSAFTLTAMLARPLFSRAARLLGRRTLAAVSLTVAAIGLLSIPLSSVRWLLIIIAAVVGTGRGLIPILSIVLISDHTEEHNRGLALSFRMLTIRAGSSINPLLFGAAASLGGMTAPFFLAGTLALVAAAAVQALPFFEFSSDTPSSTAGTSYRSPGQ